MPRCYLMTKTYISLENLLNPRNKYSFYTYHDYEYTYIRIPTPTDMVLEFFIDINKRILYFDRNSDTHLTFLYFMELEEKYPNQKINIIKHIKVNLSSKLYGIGLRDTKFIADLMWFIQPNSFTLNDREPNDTEYSTMNKLLSKL